MNDLSHIGRPRASKQRRIANARICRCSSVLLSGGRGAENISGPGGPRKSLKRLNSDKEIQGKPSHLFGLSLRGLGPIWLNLDSAWIGLGPISTRTILKAHANSRREPNSQRYKRLVQLSDLQKKTLNPLKSLARAQKCTPQPAGVLTPRSGPPTPPSRRGSPQQSRSGSCRSPREGS